VKFNYSVENFRGLAILFVMFSHVSSLRQIGGVGGFVYFAMVDATAWFVFISGYLFYYIEYSRFDYTRYLVKKAKHVVLPYLILSVPAVIAGIAFDRPLLLDLSPGAYVLWSLLVGGAVVGPMWFIPMIVLFFLTSRIFHRLAGTRYLHPLTLIALTVSLFSTRPINDLNPFLSFVHFLGFYLLGISVARGSSVIDRNLHSSATRVSMFLGLLVFVLAAWGYDAQASEPLGFFDGWGKFNTLLLGKLSLLVGMFLFFSRRLGTRNVVLGHLAENSFGLFFVHGFFMLLFLKICQHLEIPSVSLIFLLETVVVICGSIFGVFVIRLVLGKASRYVIGC
jgi:hypothetical protein